MKRAARLGILTICCFALAVGASLAGTVASGPAAAATRVVNLYNVATHKCVDIPGYDRGGVDGPVNQYTCDYTAVDNQRFYLVPAGLIGNHRIYLIKNKTDGLCLDLPDHGYVPAGTLVSEYHCNSQGDNQRWYFKSVAPGTYQIINLQSGLCLDVMGERTGGNDSRLTVARCELQDDHFWNAITDSSETVSDFYAQAYARAFADPQEEGSTRRRFEALKTPDDGLIVARFFIPDQYAGSGLLRGDNRDFSSRPWKSSRMLYAWDLKNGDASFVVTATHWRNGNSRPAYPLYRGGSFQEVLDQSEDGPRNQNYFRNRNRVTELPGQNQLESSLAVSAANSITAEWPGGSWTVDGVLSIQRDAVTGRYGVHWGGNGYPQMEVYYYDRHSGVSILARRRIDPWALIDWRVALDSSGGVAALNRYSWASCRTPVGERVMVCTEIGARSTWQEWTTRW